MHKAKRLKTQENCKQNRNSLAKRVHKEKKVFKKTFCQSQIFFDDSFFDRKMIKASYKKREDNLIHEYKSESNLQGISKVIREKSCGEGSLIEQDTIENVSEPNFFF